MPRRHLARARSREENPSTEVWIAIGVGVLLVGGVAIYLATRKTSPGSNGGSGPNPNPNDAGGGGSTFQTPLNALIPGTSYVLTIPASVVGQGGQSVISSEVQQVGSPWTWTNSATLVGSDWHVTLTYNGTQMPIPTTLPYGATAITPVPP